MGRAGQTFVSGVGMACQDGRTQCAGQRQSGGRSRSLPHDALRRSRLCRVPRSWLSGDRGITLDCPVDDPLPDLSFWYARYAAGPEDILYSVTCDVRAAVRVARARCHVHVSMSSASQCDVTVTRVAPCIV